MPGVLKSEGKQYAATPVAGADALHAVLHSSGAWLAEARNEALAGTATRVSLHTNG